MILSIGEILFDEFPDYRRLGGAPFNFAYHLKQLGLPVRFVSRVGNDADGREIADTLERLGFDTGDLQIDPIHTTGKVQVRLDEQGIPDFDILKDAAYDYLDCTPALEKLAGQARLIYFGTLVQRTPHGRGTLTDAMSRKSSGAAGFYDVNLRPNCYTRDTVLGGLRFADLLKVNEEELSLLKEMHASTGDTREAVAVLMHRYPIRWIALTLGRQGAVLFTGQERCQAIPPPVIRVADTVGAGDAFAAVLAAGYLRRMPPQAIVEAAVELAARLCTVAGAVPPGNRIYRDISRLIERG
jgi:fructokinase